MTNDLTLCRASASVELYQPQPVVLYRKYHNFAAAYAALAVEPHKVFVDAALTPESLGMQWAQALDALRPLARPWALLLSRDVYYHVLGSPLFKTVVHFNTDLADLVNSGVVMQVLGVPVYASMEITGCPLAEHQLIWMG